MEALRKKKNGNRKILMSFSVSYMVMLIIPVIMCVVACSFYISTIENAVRESHDQRISSALFQLEQSLNEADHHQQNLVSRNSGLNKLMRSNAVNTYDIRQLIDDIDRFQDGNGLFSRYYIYVRENQVLLEPGRGYISYFRDYKTSFSYGDYSAQEWLEVLNSRQSGMLPAATMAKPEGSLYAIPYITNYPLNNINCGKIIYYLDGNRVLSMLEGILNQEYPCQIWLTSGDGTLLLSNTDAAVPAGNLGNAEMRINGENYYISRLSSAKAHFVLHTSIPVAFVKASTIRSLAPMLAIMALMLVLGIIFSVYLWQLNHRPLQETLEHLSLSDSSDRRGLWQIRDAVSDLTQENHTLLELQGVQHDLLRTAAINRMLSGDLHTSHELDGLLQFIDLDIDCDCYRGIFLMLDHDRGEEENLLWLEQQKTLLSDVLSACGDQLRFLSVHDMNSFALLYSAMQKDTEEEGMRQALSGVFHQLSQRGMQNVCFYVGVPCQDFCSLSRSFHSAKELMDSNRDSLENDWLMIADKEDSQKGYHLTEQQERHLVNLARAGNREGVAQLLQRIHQENASHAATTAFSRRLLMARIVDLLLEAGYTGELEQEIRWQLFSMHFSRFFELITPHFDALCNSVRQNQANRESQLAQNIVKTLQNEFDNQDMSLTLLSLRFGIAEKRLSVLIREYTGLSFQGYLEKLRIDHANRLLETEEMTVERIAAAAGYVNDRTFRRAYIRVMGYAPSRHRQLKHEQDHLADQP